MLLSTQIAVHSHFRPIHNRRFSYYVSGRVLLSAVPYTFVM